MSPWAQKQVDNPASWVVCNRLTGAVVCELFSRATVERLNTDKYEAVPILLYLFSLNNPHVDTSKVTS